MSKKGKGKTYSFAKLQAEARAKAPKLERREADPFVLDDVQPPIVITAPDTVERQLGIAECLDTDGRFDASKAVPLLKALTGSQFGRVWELVRRDKDPNVLIALVQAIFEHFSEELADVQEAEALPGGSGASSA